jgi:hypothetical protein
VDRKRRGGGAAGLGSEAIAGHTGRWERSEAERQPQQPPILRRSASQEDRAVTGTSTCRRAGLRLADSLPRSPAAGSVVFGGGHTVKRWTVDGGEGGKQSFCYQQDGGGGIGAEIALKDR